MYTAIFYLFRMAARSNPASFLEELSPLSEALVNISGTVRQAPTAISSVFITIGNEKCFKHFASRYFNGIGNIRVPSTLD